MKIVIETTNLYLREITTEDAPFLIELLNSPAYIRYIGDRGVRTIADAIAYIQERPRKSYQENGFGLWVIVLKETGMPAGMCGLINRPELNDIDIGFALLPGYEGKGIGYEAASASLMYGLTTLNIPKIIGIVDPDNAASVQLLQRIGLQQESTVRLPGDTLELLVFGSTNRTRDLLEINALTNHFFSIFTNTDQRKPDLQAIFDLFIPEGMIINNQHGTPVIYNLQQFVEPRIAWLNDGTLVDFEEKETRDKTEVSGTIAHRLSHYSKKGIRNGVPFTAKGVKSIQFVKTGKGWKISALAMFDFNEV